MPKTRADLDALFNELGIATRSFDHPPVFTVEEAQAHTAHLPGGHCKNLFLKDKKDALWLIVCLDHQPVRMNGLQKLLGAARLSFAKPELLMEVLGVVPGSVTPFALINDTERRVQPVLDEKMLRLAPLNYHPLRNDATTAIASGDLVSFVEALGYTPLVVDLDLAIEEVPSA